MKHIFVFFLVFLDPILPVAGLEPCGAFTGCGQRGTWGSDSEIKAPLVARIIASLIQITCNSFVFNPLLGKHSKGRTFLAIVGFKWRLDAKRDDVKERAILSLLLCAVSLNKEKKRALSAFLCRFCHGPQTRLWLCQIFFRINSPLEQCFGPNLILCSRESSLCTNTTQFDNLTESTFGSRSDLFLDWKVLEDEGSWFWLVRWKGGSHYDSRFLQHDDKAVLKCFPAQLTLDILSLTFLHLSESMQCTMCTVGTICSFGLNKLGHILKFVICYTIQRQYYSSGWH